MDITILNMARHGWTRQLYILFLPFGLSILQNGVDTERKETDRNVEEFRLCNATFNWTISSHPISLRLPEIPTTSLGKPLHCQYTFLGTSHHRISLRVLELYTGQYVTTTKRCKDGNLRIWDGSRDAGRHMYPPNTFCGRYGSNDVIDSQRISSGPQAEMDFYTTGVTTMTSFRVEISYINFANETEVRRYPKQIQHSMQRVDNASSVCYWQIDLDDCEHDCPLLSPGYPGIYPPNTECYYHVTSQNAHVIFQLKASGSSWKPREFNLQKNCRSDYVEIYDGDTKENDNKVGRFCGRYFPNITTSSNNVIISFVTGSDAPPYNYTGFHLSAIGITKEWHKDGFQRPGEWCSWQLNATAGSISTPDHWLPRATTCYYSLQVPKGYYLELILHVYGLERNCLDYIEVLDGTSTLSKLCDRYVRESRETFIYNLTSPNVIVRYFTTSGQMQGQSSRGFWLSYRQIRDPSYTPTITDSSEKAQPVVDYTFSRGRHQCRTCIMTISICAIVPWITTLKNSAVEL